MSKRTTPDPAITVTPADVRAGLFSDKYFVRSREILLADGADPRVCMQVFSRSEAVLCGMQEAIALLRDGSRDFSALQVAALADGDAIAPWESVLVIEGPYTAFAHLETLYLGVLARGTRIATQTAALVAAAGGKEVLFFGARHDHHANQHSDGYAAFIGGAAAVATDAQALWWGERGVGTVPHALIAAYGGDTVLACAKFAEHMPAEVGLVALADFDNDCVGTSLAVARELGARLHGVRLDTSAALIDKSLQGLAGSDLHGVNPTLVGKVREALDAQGRSDVRIVVSGGLTEERISKFESAGSPVDAYGVGSAIVRNTGAYDFTADIVTLEGRQVSKVGRELRPNPRLAPIR